MFPEARPAEGGGVRISSKYSEESIRFFLGGCARLGWAPWANCERVDCLGSEIRLGFAKMGAGGTEDKSVRDVGSVEWVTVAFFLNETINEKLHLMFV